MDNKACKIIAIVLIVLGGLIVLWAISTIIRCMCLGFSCLEALCCCCCRSASKDYHEKQQHPYNNPNMYGPPAQPAYHPAGQPAYQPQYVPGNRGAHESYYQPSSYGYNTSNSGYEPVDSRDTSAPKDPFNERTAYRGNDW